jgi:antitoxin YefM
MVNMISLKALRPELPTVIKNVDTKLARYIITRRSKPIAVMMSVDDYESILETIEILSDKQAVRRIKQAKKEIKEGKTISLQELRQKIENA